MKRKSIILYAVSIFILSIWIDNSLYAQSIIKKDYLRSGNKEYNKARYPVADSLYTLSVLSDTNYATGFYNKGNALYLGGDAAAAQASWMRALMNTPGEEEKADILYNLGGIEMDSQNYGEAIKLYKDALRRNPSDEEARYNLALAKELLKKQEQNKDQNQNQNQNGDGDGQNDQNKDQNQDKNNQNNQDDKNKDQNQDKNNQNNQDDKNKDQNQDKNNQNNQDNKNKDQNQDKNNQNNQDDKNKDQNNSGGGSQNSPQQQPLSSQDQQMLNAIAGKEKETQEKVKGEKVQGVGKKSTKDW